MPENAFPLLRSGSSKVALVDGDASYSYVELKHRIERLATGLLAGSDDLQEERVAFFIPASCDYATALLGVWRAGGIAVPLNVASAPAELEHCLSCARITRLIVSGVPNTILHELCASLNIELLSIEEVIADDVSRLPVISEDRRAMIVFTSGTTSKPKGVVSTHKNISAQIMTLLAAWSWSDNDVIPLFLPVHHVHGIINILCCGLWAGATVHLFPRFEPESVAAQVAANTYTVFMAVPTIYVKLMQYFETIDEAEVAAICRGFGAMRLNISGSAACPVKVFNQWRGLTKQVLLERYGMTEIGMAISNPYHGDRRAGAVGLPLPGVEIALFDEDDNIITRDQVFGEIRVKGDNVFLEYWDNPAASAESFRDGWFLTGDIAVLDDGYYRIMGRSSIDIIKSGGYKLSALEIEGTLLLHDDIVECAVIGVEDETWGEVVVAFVVPRVRANLEYGEFKAWCGARMSAYKIPKRIELVDCLPRNAMGKVVKPQLKELLWRTSPG